MKSLQYNRFALVVAAASLAAALSSCGRSLPSKLDRLPQDLNNPSLNSTGIYLDGWTEDSAALDLEQPGGQEALAVRGTVPQIADPNFRNQVELRLDDKPVGHWAIGLGDFAVSAPVPSGAGKRRVALIFAKTQALPGGDGRMTAARLTFIGFEPKSKQTGSPSDVVHGMNLQLGSGWGTLETFRGETFRWIDNDARLLLTADRSGSVLLTLKVEPGPGVGSKPFVLKVLDAAGRQVAAEPVEKRGTVKFVLPVEAGSPAEFRLHVDGGGKPTPNDPRILNFRVFEMEATPWAAAK